MSTCMHVSRSSVNDSLGYGWLCCSPQSQEEEVGPERERIGERGEGEERLFQALLATYIQQKSTKLTLFDSFLGPSCLSSMYSPWAMTHRYTRYTYNELMVLLEVQTSPPHLLWSHLIFVSSVRAGQPPQWLRDTPVTVYHQQYHQL